MIHNRPIYRTLTDGQWRALAAARLQRMDPDILELVIDPLSDQMKAAINIYRRTWRSKVGRAA